MINYVTIKNLVPWRVSFMFIDIKDYLADQLFINEEVRVRFGNEYSKDGCKYICISASCRAKDWYRAQRALEALGTKMVICGNTDYEEYCNELISKMNTMSSK